MPHPPYSPELSPTDHHFFKHLNNFLQGKCIHNQQDAENASQEFVKSQRTDFYAQWGLSDFPQRHGASKWLNQGSKEHFVNIYLAAPGLSCSMQYLVPQSGMAQPGPLHGAHGVLATGPPGKFQGAFWKGADSVWTLPWTSTITVCFHPLSTSRKLIRLLKHLSKVGQLEMKVWLSELRVSGH